MVVGTLTVLKLGHSAGLLFIALAVVFQLIGGTIFAIGILGQGVQSVQAWVKKYLIFTREPTISMSIMQGPLSLLSLLTHGKGQRAEAILEYVGYGVIILMTVTILAHYLNFSQFLFGRHPSLVRPLCVAIGFSIYWIGVWLLGS